MNEKLLSLLGICRKAGKLLHGFEAASEAVQNKTAALILTSSDLSPKSKKEIEFLSSKGNIEVVSAPVTMHDIEQKTGRRAGVLAVSDMGLAKAVKKELQEINLKSIPLKN